MDHTTFFDAVKRFAMIAKQQEEQLYRRSEHSGRPSEIEDAHAKRDMYIRALRQYNQIRRF